MKRNMPYYFHVSRETRDKYRFKDEFFSIRGNLIVADGKASRYLADIINQQRISEGRTHELVSAGQIITLGLLHEIFHFLIQYYEDFINPGVLTRGINYLRTILSETELENIFSEYINHFPPLDVYKGKLSPNDFLTGTTSGKSNKEIILEEIILLNLENINPATRQLEELYSEKSLAEKTKYKELIIHTERFFSNEKPFGPENLPLIHFLRKPVVTSPYNLDGQLDYILTNWGIYIYDKFGKRILRGKDVIFEDSKLFLHHMGGKGTPPVPTYEFDKDYFEKLRAKLLSGVRLTSEESMFYDEYEKFTRDIEWMPNVVMIAKNAFVWLDQLSKKYQREIRRLDQIPDEELDRLAQWNFTALWLIGIWERSSASRKIKQMMGNPEAASSAYSLYDYTIAHELGGDAAFQNLKDRAWIRKIRLASDMVPNHTGIYSRWVIEKPHYYIQSDYPPYPGYRFTGPNLSDDPRVEIRIEDKYYSMSDAAVVFERRDTYTGDCKYIYHGNDGTHMPWNDTAQLNLLNPEVREALYQMIKHVASKTSIIRFDAAMTLTKKHYQRLWFPQPGTGGAIPSRSDFGMTREDFDRAMPQEFWREVVDRINKEMPHTLLLAEAFWLMEGYFVRTLGMHRVYNSAFMHMMMKEENEKYRLLVKNTLDFNPEILKRYVNFMSNPDEETALNQFGKGDKYFGVAVMMVTLPGLPMFGHGQAEGFSEKYGMEYQKAYYNEFVDENLVSRHQHEIFPLMGKRHLFSQVENFEFYDFVENSGNVNENVFAFSNRSGSERVIVIYNNSYTECRGTVNWSVPKVNPGSATPVIKKLSEALGLKNESRIYYSYYDHKTKFHHLISSREISDFGFYVSLNGYDYKVCLDFREIYDSTGDWDKLYRHLAGRGVYSLEQEFKELQLYPLHESIVNLINPELIEMLESHFTSAEKFNRKRESELVKLTGEKVDDILNHLNRVRNLPSDNTKIKNSIGEVITSGFMLNDILIKIKTGKEKDYKLIYNSLIFTADTSSKIKWPAFLSWVVLNGIFNSDGKDNLFDELIIGKALNIAFNKISPDNPETGNIIHLIKILAAGNMQQLWDKSKQTSVKKTAVKKPGRFSEKEFINLLFGTDDVKWYTDLHKYEGYEYFNKEKFENLINWIFSIKSLTYIKTAGKRKSKTPSGSVHGTVISNILKDFKFFKNILTASDEAGYRLESLLSSFEEKKTLKTKKTVSKPTKKMSSEKSVKIRKKV